MSKAPNESKSSLYTVLQQLFQDLGYDLQLTDIRDVSRLPSKKESRTLNTFLKSNFLESAKQYYKRNPNNKINLSHLGLEGPSALVYVGEQLTSYDKKLFYTVRNFAKLNQ